ncbi:MAG: putative sugar nucleotidyl transferase [Mariniblastus sp.]|nr:putative sugar nucleotidyl transferase [Mariniblastus sp.]
MNIIVFEDAGTEKLSPISIGRPAYGISCGSYRLVDWLRAFEGNLVGLVRPFLKSVQEFDYPDFQNELDPELKWTLVVNARLAPSVANVRRLQSIMGQAESDQSIQVFHSEGATSAAVVPTGLFVSSEMSSWHKIIDELSLQPHSTVTENGFKLFKYPHDVIMENLECIGENLKHRVGLGRCEQLHKGVYVGQGVQINDPVIFDSTHGPIVIDDEVKIGPFTFLRGPVYIGPKTRISEHASIKDGVSISHTCKIGGEIEGCVLEAFTNKQHHGFLGHSYLGSWINLGAGTCNSDLKNTYGIVNMQYGAEKVTTGTQFIGCVIGDYSKTAINTCIFTGKTIGVASMVYGFATTNVPSFVNYARTFGEVGDLPAEVIITTQQRMFLRRNVVQRPCDIQLVHDMYKLTRHERPDDLSSDPLSL